MVIAVFVMERWGRWGSPNVGAQGGAELTLGTLLWNPVGVLAGRQARQSDLVVALR
jgi:hypothetical protein